MAKLNRLNGGRMGRDVNLRTTKSGGCTRRKLLRSRLNRNMADGRYDLRPMRHRQRHRRTAARTTDSTRRARRAPLQDDDDEESTSPLTIIVTRSALRRYDLMMRRWAAAGGERRDVVDCASAPTENVSTAADVPVVGEDVLPEVVSSVELPPSDQ